MPFSLVARRGWRIAERSELLSTNRDPAWIRAYGDAGTLQVGDGLCLLHTTTTAIGVIQCTGMKFIGVSNHITKGCASEFGGGGGHLWKDCYFGPRPGTCHWQGSDGFPSGGMELGSTLHGCMMLHTPDDLINFNGLWDWVESFVGQSITLHRDSHMPAQPGDPLNFFDKETGASLGTAIEFSLVSGGEISGNTFVTSGQPHILSGKASTQDDPQPVQLKQHKDIIVKDNRP